MSNRDRRPDGREAQTKAMAGLVTEEAAEAAARMLADGQEGVSRDDAGRLGRWGVV